MKKPCKCHLREHPQPWCCAGVAGFAGKAAALGFIRVAVPRAAPTAQRLLARVGTLAAVGSVATMAVRRAGGVGLADRVSRPGQEAWGRVRRWKREIPLRWPGMHSTDAIC